MNQLVSLDVILNYIKTQSEEHSSPKLCQNLFELAQIQNYLDVLQQLVQSEMKRLNSQNSQQICKDIGSRYDILGNQVEEKDNVNWNQLAQDMLGEFEVQNGKMILKKSIQNQSNQGFSQFMNQFQKTLIEIDNKFKYILEQNDKEINFAKFIMSQPLIGHTDLVYGIDICQQRNLLASGSQDNTVKIWNYENKTLIRTYQNSGYVLDVVFSSLGNLLAFGGGDDYSIKLVDISDLEKDNIVLELHGHKANIERLVFSYNSRYLISGSLNYQLKIWNCQLKMEEFQLNSEMAITGVAIMVDDSVIASNSYDGKIRIWSFNNQTLICSTQAHSSGCGIQFSNDKKMIVSSSREGIIKLWNLEELDQSKISLIREFKAANTYIWTVLFSPCSNYIISICNEESEIKIVDLKTSEIIKLIKSKQTRNQTMFVDVAISKDLEIIAYGEDNNVAFWRNK